jgi:hypothetical protein
MSVSRTLLTVLAMGGLCVAPAHEVTLAAGYGFALARRGDPATGTSTVEQSFVEGGERRQRVLYTSGGNGWRGRLEYGLRVHRRIDGILLLEGAHKSGPVHRSIDSEIRPEVRLFTTGLGVRLRIPRETVTYSLSVGPSITHAKAFSKRFDGGILSERMVSEYGPGFGIFSTIGINWRLRTALELVARVGPSYSFARLRQSSTHAGDSTVILKYVTDWERHLSETVRGTTRTLHLLGGTIESFSALPVMVGVSVLLGGTGRQ